MRRGKGGKGAVGASLEYQLPVDETSRGVYDSGMVAYDHQPHVEDGRPSGPNWPALRELAAGQAGHVTAAQAGASGFSEQLLSKHVASGNLLRPLRGIYRLAHYPPADNEDLVVAWLWSGARAVVSHESALQLHHLSDAFPARIHLTLPLGEQRRRRVIPPLYALHFADIAEADRAWIGAVPVTTPARTVRDVAADFGDADLVRQAIEDGAIQSRQFSVWDVVDAVEYARSVDTPGWKVFPEAITDLRDAWYVCEFSGVCGRPAPPDWPSLAREVVNSGAGRVYVQRHHRRSATLSFQVAWSTRPDPESIESLRQGLARLFAWR